MHYPFFPDFRSFRFLPIKDPMFCPGFAVSALAGELFAVRRFFAGGSSIVGFFNAIFSLGVFGSFAYNNQRKKNQA